MSALAKKLQIKPEMHGTLRNAPADLTLPALQRPPAEGDPLHYLLVFVHSVADVDRYAADAVAAVAGDGILWFCYPKKSSGVRTDIHRDTGWDALTALGYRPVRQVSIDEIWSALRFRPAALVKSR